MTVLLELSHKSLELIKHLTASHVLEDIIAPVLLILLRSLLAQLENTVILGRVQVRVLEHVLLDIIALQVQTVHSLALLGNTVQQLVLLFQLVTVMQDTTVHMLLPRLPPQLLQKVQSAPLVTIVSLGLEPLRLALLEPITH